MGAVKRSSPDHGGEGAGQNGRIRSEDSDSADRLNQDEFRRICILPQSAGSITQGSMS